MKPTLLILAAGMGSRYGGIKQLELFGPSGETLMDYSLYDAIRAGFGKVVFIIREELRGAFTERFDQKLTGKIAVDYAIQTLDAFVPADLGEIKRSKPWGTAHAMLCAKDHTQTPFAVINADDYYGVDAFQMIHDFLTTNTEPTLHALISYAVENTLSEHGSVSRGVCDVATNGRLKSVVERTTIYRTQSETSQSPIVYEVEGNQQPLAAETPVSMNFWGFKPDIFPQVQQQFEQYARRNIDIPKAEFYIPSVMMELIKTNSGQCQVFQSHSNWFGVTYPADKEWVRESLLHLHQEGVYPQSLW